MNKFEGIHALRILKTIHWSITLLPLLFAAIVFYMNSNAVGGEVNEAFLYSSIIVMALAIPGSSFLFKSYLRKMNLNSSSASEEVFQAFQTAHLLRLLVIETAGFFGIVCAYITGSNLILGVTVFAVVFMASMVPSYLGIADTFNFVNE